MIENDIKLLEHCVLDLQHRVQALEAQVKALQRQIITLKLQADRKTEPQYDFGEYADRLWKIAYERGKREALEQTEPQTERSE